MNYDLVRDEEAVSAAVATVLLFGGVLSIIGMMMISMIPVIEELQGSVERHDMSSQMTLLAKQTAELSEAGMPGDSTEVELIPIDGNIVWDKTRGGMWYSATWFDDNSLRMRGALDFDDSLDIRHSESEVKSVCIDDLRLGPLNPYIYSVPSWVDDVRFAAAPGLAIPLGPIDIDIYQDGVKEEISLALDHSYILDLRDIGELSIKSSHKLVLMFSAGDGGATVVTANDVSPVDKTGRSWSIPLPSGQSQIHIVSDIANQVRITKESTTTTTYSIPSGSSRLAVASTHDISMQAPGVVHVSTSASSHLLLRTNIDGGIGSTSWPSTNGALLGHEFNTPSLNGELAITNPNNDPVTITWKGGGTSVSAQATAFISWPPETIDDSPIIDASSDIFVSWSASSNTTKQQNVSSVNLLPAVDTGATSGNLFLHYQTESNIQHQLSSTLQGFLTNYNASMNANQTAILTIDSPSAIFNASEGTSKLTADGNPIRVHHLAGSNGLIQAMHDGEQRCVAINVQASGWITTSLPWKSFSGRSEIDVERGWTNGEHPASMSISVLAVEGANSHSTIGTVWAFHLSRLTYEFSSSIMGMEVAYSGGAVVTNHPEFEAFIVTPPSDRGGPGPRFAATIPSLHPTSNSLSGGGKLSLDIELEHRQSLASTTAYEVRRGWSSPYGEAIAVDSADGLESSEDWTIYPGRIDLLTDYVGWVPDPSFNTAESIWHTNGEAIQFTLQMSSLTVDIGGEI
ncbi:MAG: hypothetical protein P8Q55_06115 [Candidatus Poseidoniaceae archaeon]|nr:hypothetical protein [Candidatus Poseidoniaceae archaeon]